MAQLSSFPTMPAHVARGLANWPPNLRPVSCRIRLKPPARSTSVSRGATTAMTKAGAAAPTGVAGQAACQGGGKSTRALALAPYLSDRLETALWVTLAFISVGLLALSFG
jgi:hypothetical protein